MLKTQVSRKFNIGDKAYYLDNGKIQELKITAVHPVVDRISFYPHKEVSNIIGWEYVTDYKKNAMMDGLYAPVNLVIKEEFLYKDKEDIFQNA